MATITKSYVTHIVCVYCGVMGYGKRLPTVCIFTANLNSHEISNLNVYPTGQQPFYTQNSKLLLWYCNTHGYSAQNHMNAMSTLYPPKYTEMTHIILKIGKSTGENAGRKC